ncbi:heme binding [Tulasnella sp. 330]|nr:heme binding [Tulasnella sp. 330]
MTSVVLETSMGQVTLELYWDHAPKTCKNFSELARRGYYNGLVFHRIIPDFMIQGGDPTGTGRGGTSIYGQKFEDEFNPELRFVGAGILAMANSGPNTNGSQFFISLGPTPFLDDKHTIFGRVTTGMRVVQRIGAVKTDSQDSHIVLFTEVRDLVDNDIVGKISKGLLVLIGIGVVCGELDDTPADMEAIAKKILAVRVFDDENGTMWKHGVKDIGGEVLCVSQFTLMAKTTKGSKPDFHGAMGSESSRSMYSNLLSRLGELYDPSKIQDGRFGAMMSVSIMNEGPVTIPIDSRKFEYVQPVSRSMQSTNSPTS